ncbi:AAA family ATPase [Streptomyces microflavus]|uniref:AAA family ATPase n=1 Tax=Streptomyces microflavus TaxID=1919 RepID=UPI0038041E65
MFTVIGGLPGTGRTTLARLLAARIGAVHLRVDTIEQAIVRSGLARHPVGPAGYTVGYALASEHLQQCPTVIAESVNPLAVTRDAWREAGTGAGVRVVEVEVVCSDPAEHRHRLATSSCDLPELPLPDWQQVLDRDYEPWGREHVVVDTAGQAPQEFLVSLVNRLGEPGGAEPGPR